MRALLVATVMLAACGGRGASFPQVPMVPATFETNLMTARECEFLAAVESEYEAHSSGANLFVVFVYTQMVTGLNGVNSTSYVAPKGKAVKCPESVLRQLVGGRS